MVNRSEVIEVLKKVLGVEYVPNHMIITDVMGACAYLFAYPEEADDKAKATLKRAYEQIREKGFI